MQTADCRPCRLNTFFFLFLFLHLVLTRIRFGPGHIRPSKKKHASRPDFYKKESGRAGGFFLLFIISYCMLSLHIIYTFPQGYVGALRSIDID